MKTIFIGLPCYGGKIEAELALWLCAQHQFGFRLAIEPIRNLYIEQSRNMMVSKAREEQADYLLMIDSDTEPTMHFLPESVALLESLRRMDRAGVVGAPYLSSFDTTTVWVARDGNSCRLSAEQAMGYRGFEEALNVGTGCFLIDMRIFDRLKKPYFRCVYVDEAMEELRRTEDTEFTNKVRLEANGHVFVAWDHWANHYKEQKLGKPRQSRPRVTPPAGVEGLTSDMGDLYAEAVARVPNGGRMVEIGCWKGASTIMLANLIKRSGKDIWLMAVDTFRGSYDEDFQCREVETQGGSLRRIFDANLERHGVAGLVDVVEMDSVAAANEVAEGSLDFVYLDAQHSYAAVREDIAAWLSRVKPGGILAGHDYLNDDFPGVRKAVDELLPGAQLVAPRSWLWEKPLHV